MARPCAVPMVSVVPENLADREKWMSLGRWRRRVRASSEVLHSPERLQEFPCGLVLPLLLVAKIKGDGD